MEKGRLWRGGVCKTVLRLSVAFIRANKIVKNRTYRPPPSEKVPEECRERRGEGEQGAEWDLRLET